MLYIPTKGSAISPVAVRPHISAVMKILEGITLLVVLVIVDCRRTEEDYVEDPNLGRRYQLMYEAETWQAARARCAQAGGKLAVPKSEEEFRVIQGLVRKMHFPSIRGLTGSKLVAWLGISSLDNYRVWKNVDGEDVENSGFSTWAEGNGAKSDNPREPHCAVVDAVNPGLRDYWCHLKQPFVCERVLKTTN